MHSYFESLLSWLFSCFLFWVDSAPSNSCERIKWARSSSFQYCMWAAIAERYDASKSPSYQISCELEYITCMTKSTRPVEFIALSLSASWRAVLRPVVLCLKTEYRVSSGINPTVGVEESFCWECWFWGEMSAYPNDREIRDDVMLDLLLDMWLEELPNTWPEIWCAAWDTLPYAAETKKLFT